MRDSLQLTDRTARYLADYLAKEEDRPEVCFQLTRSREGSISIVTGEICPDDETIDLDGRPVLAVSPAVHGDFAGFTLDISDEPDGSKTFLLVATP